MLSWTVIIYNVLTGALYSEAQFKGGLDTTFYATSVEKSDFSNSLFNGIFHQNIYAFYYDPDDDKFSFHLNTRFSYETEPFAGGDPMAIQLYYGYVRYNFFDSFGMKLGRILELNNIGITYFDGVLADLTILDWNLRLSFYGGYMLHDDYIINDQNFLTSPGSLDYRAMFLTEREGDYLEGVSLAWNIPGAVLFNVEWQASQNLSKMVEHYLTVDFETALIANFLQFSGYGTFDMMLMRTVHSHEEIRGIITKELTVLLEHEYLRPVFPADSYWYIFNSLPSNEVRMKVQYKFSPYFFAEAGYGLLAFDDTAEALNHTVYASLMHQYLEGFQVRLDGELISGPLDQRLRALLFVSKDLKILVATVGGGYEHYSKDEYSDITHDAWMATVGAKVRFSRNFHISLMGEYYSNPYYVYSIRGLLKGSYWF